MIKSILHHVLGQGHSQRRCAAALGLSKAVVAKYTAAAAAAAGLGLQTAQTMSEAELTARLAPRRAADARVCSPDFARIHRELSRKGVTLMLLWQEYQAEHLGVRVLQYSQFCERHRRWAGGLKRSMRQVHRAGERLFIDFAGPMLAPPLGVLPSTSCCAAHAPTTEALGAAHHAVPTNPHTAARIETPGDGCGTGASDRTAHCCRNPFR